jgi:hypothetical protein
MTKYTVVLWCSLTLTAGIWTESATGFPGVWDPHLYYLNVQVDEADVPQGSHYWRLAEGYATPPPDEGFGAVTITYQTKDLNGNFVGGKGVRVFSEGGTWQTGSTPGVFSMAGGNWLDFYNQIGPYCVEIVDQLPSDVCRGLGLPANLHFSYTIVFQEAIKGVTPNPPAPEPVGKPAGENLLVNPGAETGDGEGWSLRGVSLNADIFTNCGNRAGDYRFSWATYDGGNADMSQTLSLIPGRTYTFGFWVSKKSSETGLSLSASWSDSNGGGGSLYTMPPSETIFPIYGTRQGAEFTPQGSQVTIRLDMNYTGAYFAAFHLDEFWLLEKTNAHSSLMVR